MIKTTNKGKTGVLLLSSRTGSLADVRRAYADSLLAFPPLPIFAESPSTHNRGEIQFAESQEGTMWSVLQ